MSDYTGPATTLSLVGGVNLQVRGQLEALAQAIDTCAANGTLLRVTEPWGQQHVVNPRHIVQLTPAADYRGTADQSGFGPTDEGDAPMPRT